ncbi:MAG: hypothetical protein RLZZ385_1357 [Pseudomonadota bacterium]|jgi:DNA repair protein RecO (recombination protein O)
MDNRVLLQPVYVLHKQAFQNSSLLVDFFSMEHGRVKAVARGARREKSRYRALLQSFHPLLVSFSGRGEVKTVIAVESSVSAIRLTGERLFSGLYVNELLTRLLQGHGEHHDLFQHYQNTLLALQDGQDLQTVLRAFELRLLDELGYGINLQQDYLRHEPIDPAGLYLYIPDLGFEAVEYRRDNGIREPQLNEFTGQHIIDLQRLCFADDSSRRAARRLLRLALQAHLGGRPVHSRNLFARQRGSAG